MVTLNLKLHQSLWQNDEPHEFTGSFENLTIIEAIRQLLKEYPKILELCLSNGKKRPGILYIAEKVELASLGLLENQLDEDLEIRIVPVLHGG